MRRVTFSRSPVSEQGLLRSLVHHKSKVTCIGGFTAWPSFDSPFHDPSPAFLASLVRSKNVTLVDCQSDSLLHRLSQSAAQRKAQDFLKNIRVLGQASNMNGTGLGDLYSYREALQFRNFGKKGIRLRPAFAWDTRLRPNSQDLVVDRMTSDWLAEQGRLRDSLSHYLTITKPCGRILFILKSRGLTTAPLSSQLKGSPEYLELKGLLSPLLRQGKVSLEIVKLDTAQHDALYSPKYRGHFALIINKLK